MRTWIPGRRPATAQGTAPQQLKMNSDVHSSRTGTSTAGGPMTLVASTTAVPRPLCTQPPARFW
jgi:hypothetical protein